MAGKTKTQEKKTRDAAASAAPSGDLLDLDQAIAALKTTRPTFYRWLRSGKFKGMKVGRQWRFYRSDIDRFLKGEGPATGPAVDLTPFLQQISDTARELGLSPFPVKAQYGDSETSVVRAVNFMLLLAAQARASDIHLAPFMLGADQVTRLMLRIDGVLRTAAEGEVRFLRPLIERWKMMANCDLHESKLPQDGRVEIQIGGRSFDLRVSFLPTALGESLTVRVLAPDAMHFDLKAIGYSPADLDRIEKALARPWGLLVVTGPAGSGKTTTLYSCLTKLASPKRKLVTVEHPVEYILPGVIHTAVRPQSGMLFAPMLRAILRSAPNVIMIGQIADSDTLELAHQAALSGHLVLTTLHAEDAANALKRMQEIGSDPLISSESVKLVIGQRLVRRLCVHCARKSALDGDRLIELTALAASSGLKAADLPREVFTAQGCRHCNQTGFQGQVVIAESLVVTPEVSAAVKRGADEVRSTGLKQGMTTLIGDGLRKAAQGLTTIEEVLRHLPTPSAVR